MQPFAATCALFGFMIVAVTMLFSGEVLGESLSDSPDTPGRPFFGRRWRDGHHGASRRTTFECPHRSADRDRQPSGSFGHPGVRSGVESGTRWYTLLIANVSLVVNPFLYPKMPYDPLMDFMPQRSGRIGELYDADTDKAADVRG
jgi:hypothetical protein